jgi:hypothetical protein
MLGTACHVVPICVPYVSTSTKNVRRGHNFFPKKTKICQKRQNLQKKQKKQKIQKNPKKTKKL